VLKDIFKLDMNNVLKGYLSLCLIYLLHPFTITFLSVYHCSCYVALLSFGIAQGFLYFSAHCFPMLPFSIIKFSNLIFY
jgi:hypothetical protein